METTHPPRIVSVRAGRSWLIAMALVWLFSSLPANVQENTVAEAEKLKKTILELYQQGRVAEAAPLAMRVAEIFKRVAGEDSPDYAASLNDLAYLYYAQSRYAEAEPLYKRSLAIMEKALGAEHPQVASVLGNLAILYQAQGRYADAEAIYKRYLPIFEKAFGADHPDLAIALNNLALLYYAQGRYAEAEPILKSSLAIREKILGPTHPDVATSLENLALLYEGQGRNAKAEPLFERSLAIREKVLGPDHPDVAMSLNFLGSLRYVQGRYKEAEPLLVRALAIREKILAPDDPDLATSLNNLGMLSYAQSRYTEAEPLYRRALAIREKVLGPDHPDVARCLNNMAALYVVQSRYVEAEPILKHCLAILEKTLGPDHPDVAQGLNNLAELYREQGRYAEAEPLYRRALAVKEKALGADRPEVAQSLNNLAVLFDLQGRYAEAEPLYVRSLAIMEKALGPNHPDVARTQGNLAEVLKAQGRDAEARPFMERSLAVYEKALGPDHPDVASALNNLADLLHDHGLYAEAEPLYERALAILEKAAAPGHPGLATTMNNLAELYREQGRYAEADPLYKRSLTIREMTLGPDHPDVAVSLFNSAALACALDRPTEAEPLFERGLEILSKRFEYSFLYMSERDRLRFLSTVDNDFPLYFSFCLRVRERLPELAGKMYDVVLWRKGAVGRSIAALRAKIRASGDPEAMRLLDRLTEKKNELAGLASAAAEADPQEQAARRERIDRLAEEANALEKELVTRSSAAGEERDLARVSWPQVRDALKPDEAAVEVVQFRYHDGKRWTKTSYYVALLLRHDSQQPAFVVLGEQKDLERVPLADYRRLVAVPETDTKRPSGLGQRFSAAFWQPLEAKLAGSKRIFLSPDGLLNQVSFLAVPGQDGRLLIETYELRTINSTKDLLQGEGPQAAGLAVLVGNPKFGLSESEQRAALRSVPADEPRSDKPAAVMTLVGAESRRSRDLRGDLLAELQGTEQEIENVSTILRRRGWKVQLLTQTGALEERVKGVRRPRVLHLATHGFFEPDQERRPEYPAERIGEKGAALLEDPMLRSGLYLTGANRVLKGSAPVPDLEDGILTAYEASQLNLQGTELVVLSACQTGMGKIQAGEGVFGLRRALQVAGAEAVLMSMWSVPDKETQELMGLYYEKWLAGKDKAAALRDAQLEMRRIVNNRYGQDLPFFWAAFVMVGVGD